MRFMLIMVRLTFYYLLRIYYVTRNLTLHAPPLSCLIFSYEAETYYLRSAAIRIQVLINSFGLSCAYTRLESIGRNSLRDCKIPNLPELQRLVERFKNKYFLFYSK